MDFVLGKAAWNIWMGTVPEPITMGSIGVLAFIANVIAAALLFAYRDGDANMWSVWLSFRNDAIGDCAVMLAALGVWGANSGWPDVVVATLMGGLAISAARSVVMHALAELMMLKPREQ